MKYIVVELQTTGNTVAHIVTDHNDQQTAEQKFHNVLAAAAVSNVQLHGAMIMPADMRDFRRELYDRTDPEHVQHIYD